MCDAGEKGSPAHFTGWCRNCLGQCSPDFEGYSTYDLLLYFSFPITPFPMGQRIASREKWMLPRLIVGSPGLWETQLWLLIGTVLGLSHAQFHLIFIPNKRSVIKSIFQRSNWKISNSPNIRQLVWNLGLGHHPPIPAVWPQAECEAFHSRLLFQSLCELASCESWWKLFLNSKDSC